MKRNGFLFLILFFMISGLVAQEPLGKITFPIGENFYSTRAKCNGSLLNLRCQF